MTPAAPDFAAIRRREFPITATSTYLDSAARGPLPRAHVAAVERFLRGMSETMSIGDSAALIEATRARAARLLNCGTEDVALLATTSQGLNSGAGRARLAGVGDGGRPSDEMDSPHGHLRPGSNPDRPRRFRPLRQGSWRPLHEAVSATWSG